MGGKTARNRYGADTAGLDGLEQFQPIHTSGRQQEITKISKAAHTVL